MPRIKYRIQKNPCRYCRYLLLLRSVKFYKRLYLKSGLLHHIFWSFMIFNCDNCMRTVFIPLHKAISNLLSQFHDYVSGNAWYCMMCLSVYICISLSASAWLANKCVHIIRSSYYVSTVTWWQCVALVNWRHWAAWAMAYHRQRSSSALL